MMYEKLYFNTFEKLGNQNCQNWWDQKERQCNKKVIMLSLENNLLHETCIKGKQLKYLFKI